MIWGGLGVKVLRIVAFTSYLKGTKLFCKLWPAVDCCLVDWLLGVCVLVAEAGSV